MPSIIRLLVWPGTRCAPIIGAGRGADPITAGPAGPITPRATTSAARRARSSRVATASGTIANSVVDDVAGTECLAGGVDDTSGCVIKFANIGLRNEASTPVRLGRWSWG